MSEQTKQQAMGYMAQALFDAAAPADEIKAFLIYAHENLATNATLDNYSSWDFLEEYLINRNAHYDKRSETRGALYWAHDEITVDEAGEIYNAWRIILRLYRRLEAYQ